jgi:hypothetical protein
VYQILGDISASFSNAQMDMLFSKFQAAKSRSVPDTLLLLELCKRLAESDAKVRGRWGAARALGGCAGCGGQARCMCARR